MAESPVMKRPIEPVQPNAAPGGQRPTAVASDATEPATAAEPIAKSGPQSEKPVPLKKAEARMNPPVPKHTRSRSLVRPILFLMLPLALAAGFYVYVTGGQILTSDNAYIQADELGISTDVAGTVIDIAVRENEAVKKGQILYRLKPDSYQIALDSAKAQLNAVRAQILTLKASYKLSLAQLEQAQSDLTYYQLTYNRQLELASTGAGTKAALDAAAHDLDAIKQKIEVAKVQALVMLAQFGGDADQATEDNPLYRQAKLGVDNAQSDLNDTVVKAPFDGIVTNVNAIQLGSYLQASQQAFQLVSSTHMWVTVSPKETELTYVRPGQPAKITVDTYPDLEWHGRVESISPASGSSFSLLPAQNTTGNWVKVVQRIPMRVSIDDMEGKPPLRVGMSVNVGVDTGHARGVPTFIKDILESLAQGKAKPHG